MALKNNIKKETKQPQKIGFKWVIVISIIFCEFFTYALVRTESTQTILGTFNIRKELAQKISYQKALLIERERLKSDERITKIAKTRLNLITDTLSQTIYLPQAQKPDKNQNFGEDN